MAERLECVNDDMGEADRQSFEERLLFRVESADGDFAGRVIRGRSAYVGLSVCSSVHDV